MRTRFSDWLEENRYNNNNFAEKMNADLKLFGVNYTVKSRTVESWRYGRAVPRPVAIQSILRVTNGDIGPMDFIEDAKAAKT